MKFESSELIISNGRIYHLDLAPDELTDIVITVGDPQRVEKVSKHFDHIEFKREKREFVTHGGVYKGKKISVISTGIGPDNIDIVLNELDALANIDFETRTKKENHRTLSLIRMGTSGSIDPSLKLGDTLVSAAAIGIDNLMYFYDYSPSDIETDLSNFAEKVFEGNFRPLSFEGSKELLHLVNPNVKKGITITCPGFYGPQGRQLLGKNKYPHLIEQLSEYQNPAYYPVTNLEMETSAIYGLSNVLGHKALSFSAILAERHSGQFHPDPKKLEEDLIADTLDWIAEKL